MLTRAWVLGICGLMAAQTQTQTAPLATVAGTVVRGDSGEPLKKASVVLMRTQGGGQQQGGRLSAVTGEDGRFEVPGVAAGVYRVRATRNGFLDAEYGQRSFGAAGAAVTVGSGQGVNGLTVRMMTGGVISGVVTNEDGEKLVRANVQLYMPTYGETGMRWTMAGSDSTNDLGEYRLFGLRPGRYLVGVTVQRMGFGPGRAGEGTEEADGYAAMYYPGTMNTDEAAEVAVTAGGEARGIDFQMRPVKLQRVRGVVRMTAAAPVAANAQRGPMGPGRAMVFLMNEGRTGMGNRLGGAVDAQGRFDIRGVPAGRYTLVAESMDRNQRESARMPVVVGAGGLDQLELRLVPPMALRGELRSEPKGAVDLTTLTVRMQPVEGGPGPMMGGGPGGRGQATGADGVFQLEGLGFQSYSLNVGGLAETLYVKGVKLGDQDFTHALVDLTNGAAGTLTVTVASGAATVSGTVAEGDKPTEGAQVVLVPEAARRGLGRNFKTAVTDQNGQFSLKGIAPGEYRIFAWDAVENGIWRNPAWLAGEEARGKSLSLRSGAQETVQLVLLRGQGE